MLQSAVIKDNTWPQRCDGIDRILVMRFTSIRFFTQVSPLQNGCSYIILYSVPSGF